MLILEERGTRAQNGRNGAGRKGREPLDRIKCALSYKTQTCSKRFNAQTDTPSHAQRVRLTAFLPELEEEIEEGTIN